MTNVKEAEEKVQRLKDELAAAESELKAATDSGITALAETMHKKFCGYNHTDQCAWGYEEDGRFGNKWGQQAHARWLEKAVAYMAAVEDLDADIHPTELSGILELLSVAKI